MMNFETIRTRRRVFQQLTGFTVAAFEALLAAFDRDYSGDRQPRDRGRPTPRQRRHGGGRQGALPTAADTLVFLLFLFRHYPTQETLAFLFGFRQGQACQGSQRLTPIVNRALGSEWQLPPRQPAELHEVLATCPGLEFLIDGTERPIRRPRDRQRRRDDYSGQKKRHTKKNIVITDKPTAKLVGLGPTQVGSRHDKACVGDDGYGFPEAST
jgi:DDE superfamily endonuclease